MFASFKGASVDSLAALWKLGKEASISSTAFLKSGGVASVGGAGSAATRAAVDALKAKAAGRAAAKVHAGRGVAVAPPTPFRDMDDSCSAIDLALEKAFAKGYGLLLMEKKRYAGVKWEASNKAGTEFKGEELMKGVDAVRRDRTLLVRTVGKKMLRALIGCDEDGVPLSAEAVAGSTAAVRYDACIAALKSSLRALVRGELPPTFTTLSKGLRGTYSGTAANTPHVAAWRRMVERGDAGIPPIGARMPYVILLPPRGKGGKKCKTRLYQRAEHPAHAAATAQPIDWRYYLECVTNPVAQTLEYTPQDVRDAATAAIEDACAEADARALGVKLMKSATVAASLGAAKRGGGGGGGGVVIVDGGAVDRKRGREAEVPHVASAGGTAKRPRTLAECMRRRAPK